MSQTPRYSQRPPMISDRSVQAVANNQLASGYGARETALGESDRRGISRGKGQQYFANVAQEAADAQGQAAAAKTQMDAAAANNAAQYEWENSMRNEKLANASLLEGLRNTQAMENLGYMANAQQLSQGNRSRQFGLDSMSLDYTPLLQGLFN